MRFFAALGVFFLFAAAMAAGIVLTVAKGNPWLLLASAGVFGAMFLRIGCATH